MSLDSRSPASVPAKPVSVPVQTPVPEKVPDRSEQSVLAVNSISEQLSVIKIIADETVADNESVLTRLMDRQGRLSEELDSLNAEMAEVQRQIAEHQTQPKPRSVYEAELASTYLTKVLETMSEKMTAFDAASAVNPVAKE